MPKYKIDPLNYPNMLFVSDLAAFIQTNPAMGQWNPLAATPEEQNEVLGSLDLAAKEGRIIDASSLSLEPAQP